jgi:hypothetical protein
MGTEGDGVEKASALLDDNRAAVPTPAGVT